MTTHPITDNQLPATGYELQSPPPELAAYRAMELLNSFARSKPFFGQAAYIVKHIYEMKRHAILEAHAAGIATHRRVRVEVKCRGCGGTGCYVDCNGYKHDHHYECQSTGNVNLYFVETVIAGGPTWHSPSLKFPHTLEVALGWDKLEQPWSETAEDITGQWAPNQPGCPLAPDELAEALITAETAFFWPLFRDALPHRVTMLQNQGSYRLDLGIEVCDRCYFCKALHLTDAENRPTSGIHWQCDEDIPPFRWHISVCPDCLKTRTPMRKYKGIIPVPAIAQTAPILHWGITHMGYVPPHYVDHYDTW